MRIRTDGDKAYRRDAIEKASRFYDCNKTTAVVSACEDVPQVDRAAETVLERDDLTMQQKQEIAETLTTRATSSSVAGAMQVERGEAFTSETAPDGISRRSTGRLYLIPVCSSRPSTEGCWITRWHPEI